MLRLARTWAFGGKRGFDPNAAGFAGGPLPPGMGFNSGRRFTLTLGVNAMNALNHPNYAAPSGDLSSPFFGISRSLGGGFGPMGGSGTANRQIDVQLRLGF
jgi:hypothetical protein